MFAAMTHRQFILISEEAVLFYFGSFISAFVSIALKTSVFKTYQ